MKYVIKLLLLLAFVSAGHTQTVTLAGRTQWGDSLKWGDSDDSTGYLLIRGATKKRDSAGTWRTLTGGDSCSLPVRLGFTTLPSSKLEMSYEVRTSSGNTDSSQVKLRMDSRYCKGNADTTKCETWVPAGRFVGDTSTFVMDSLITKATASGVTWKPTRQLFDVPGGTHIRVCVDGFKTGTSATDSTFFRRFVVRTSSVPAGGIPPSAVSISGVTLSGSVDLLPGANNIGDVDIASAPTGTSSITVQGTAATDAVAVGNPLYVGGRASTAVPTAVSADGDVVPAWHLRTGALAVNLRDASGAEVSVGGGTQYAEDQASADGQTGTLGLAVRKATPANTSGTDGDLEPMQVSGGRLWVDASGKTLTVDPSGVTSPVSAASLPLPSGASTSAKQPALGTAGSSSTDVISVQGIASGTALPVSAAALPLPSGAATAAKQPALGTAGSSSTDVISVQGIASGTAMPVSAASLPLPSGAATSANQSTEITALQIIDDLPMTEDVAHNSGEKGVMPLAVRRDANTTLADATGDYAPLQVDASGSLKVAITAGAGSGGTSIADDAAFTNASTSVTPVAGVYNSTLGTVSDGAASALAITPKGSLMVNLRDNSGNELSVGGGTQFAEDVASSNADVGTIAMAIRKATPANTSGTDGDYEPMQVSAGRLWVDASGKTLTVDPSGVTSPISAASLPLPSGAATAAKQPALGTAGTSSADVITVQGRASMTPLLVDPSGVTSPVSLASVPSHAVTNAGTFATQATIAAGAAAIAKAEDVASADADVGVPAFAVRKATPANTSGTDGDYEALQISAGRVWASATIDAALPTGSNTIGALTANQSVNVAQVNGVTTLMGNGVTGTGSQRVTIASDNTAFTVNAAQSGTWTVQPGNTANTTAWKVDNSAVNQPTVGAAAQGASVSGAPILQGLEGRSTVATAVTDGQAERAVATVDGKQIFMPFAIQGARWSYAAASGGITNTTAATMKAAAGSGIRVCLTSIDIENGHATVSTEVVIKDGAGGTVIKRFWTQAAGGGISKVFSTPLCGTANTLMEVVPITTGSAIYVNAEGYVAAE